MVFNEPSRMLAVLISGHLDPASAGFFFSGAGPLWVETVTGGGSLTDVLFLRDQA